jgi:hypothetical protein
MQNEMEQFVIIFFNFVGGEGGGGGDLCLNWGLCVFI